MAAKKATPAPAPLTLTGKLAAFESTYVGKLVFSFGRAFIGVFVGTFAIGITGVLQNLAAGKGGFTTAEDATLALVLAAVSAAVTAGVKAAQLKVLGTKTA